MDEPAVIAASETPAPDASNATPAPAPAPVVLDAWDSPEALEASSWMQELPEDRRSWLMAGVRPAYDRLGELETHLSEQRVAAETAKAEATRWLGMLEAANPEFKDLRAQVADLQTKAQGAADAAAELERLRGESASLKELRAAHAEQQTAAAQAQEALAAVRAELAALQTQHADAETKHGQDREALIRDREALIDHYGGALERLVRAAFQAQHPQATTAQVDAALRAWSDAFAEGDETPAEQQLGRAFGAMAATLPKPDAVPRSVTAMNHGASARGSDLSDEDLARRFFASPDPTGKALAAETGLDAASMLARIQKYSARAR